MVVQKNISKENREAAMQYQRDVANGIRIEDQLTAANKAIVALSEALWFCRTAEITEAEFMINRKMDETLSTHADAIKSARGEG